MDILCLLFPVLLYRSSVDAVQNDKRLVLHSETDVVQEILKLRTEFSSQQNELNNQKLEIQNLTTTQSLHTLKLQEKDAIIQNLTTALNEHTFDIKTLKSDHQATVSDLNNNEAKLRALEQTVAKQPTHAAGMDMLCLLSYICLLLHNKQYLNVLTQENVNVYFVKHFIGNLFSEINVYYVSC